MPHEAEAAGSATAAIVSMLHVMAWHGANPEQIVTAAIARFSAEDGGDGWLSPVLAAAVRQVRGDDMHTG
jgi:hypothetical protein